jgi:phosphopantothenoylcysteine synthetase/decarboxylase
VETAEEMYQAVMAHASGLPDHHQGGGGSRLPAQGAESRENQESSRGSLVLELTRNPDILAELGQPQTGTGADPGRFCGRNGKGAAFMPRRRCGKSSLDFIVANDLTAKKGAGFAC